MGVLKTAIQRFTEAYPDGHVDTVLALHDLGKMSCVCACVCERDRIRWGMRLPAWDAVPCLMILMSIRSPLFTGHYREAVP